MIKVLLVLHVFVTIALIGVVLIQRSEGGGLGLGGGQGMGNFMSGRGTANLLTRTTAILGTAFFALSLGLALLYKSANADNTAAILNAPPASSGAPIPGLPAGGVPAAGGKAGDRRAGLPASLPQTPADATPAPAVPAPGVPAPAVPAPAVPAPAAPASGKTN
jgi:preprotein translocase subunit SecG